MDENLFEYARGLNICVFCYLFLLFEDATDIIIECSKSQYVFLYSRLYIKG